ncbi:MAG TPA: hypothetical protein VFZ53_15220 [Polyangiaceae bacterium]
MSWRASLAVLLGVLAGACERKAPGPEECRRFARTFYGVPEPNGREAATRRELALREQVDELTRECLVVPYDRQLLRCTVETGRARACRAAFERRRALGGERNGVR